MKQQQQKPASRTRHQPPCEDRTSFRHIPCPARLRHQPGGAHAQKTKEPVKRRDDHRTDANRTNGGRRAKLADHAGIHRAQDRHRGIRYHNRDRDMQHALMGDRFGICAGTHLHGHSQMLGMSHP